MRFLPLASSGLRPEVQKCFPDVEAMIVLDSLSPSPGTGQWLLLYRNLDMPEQYEIDTKC